MMLKIEGAKDVRQIGGATLILGDCVEVVPHLEGQIDLIFCDAAYELTRGGGTSALGKMGGKFAIDEYANDGEIVPCLYGWSDWLPHILAALPDGCDAYLMTNDRHLAECRNVTAACGVDFHRTIVWDKGRPTPGRWGMQSLEFINYFYKKPARKAHNKSLPQYIKYPAPRAVTSGRLLHPTEKPSGLIEVFIKNSSQPGDVVFDPMMGSASTGVAALNLGRKFVGIEYDEAFYELACARMAGAIDRPSLFGAAQ